MLRVSLLWHMHQPYYVDPLTRTALMPWVRLHAVKGYLDMAAMAERHPEVRLVFNLTPVLLKQVGELARGEVRDLWREWTLLPAADLSPPDKRLLLEHFFKANWDNLVRPHPRYHELLARRGYDLGHTTFDAVASAFSRQDFLDLQVWFNLAWCGHAAFREHPELAELKLKGRGFSEEDKKTVLGVHQRVLESLVGRYRRLAERGGVELSTSPFFHPISPLLWDTAFAHRAMPMAALPPRFQHPEDLEAQVRLAAEQHRALFGTAPCGLWPSEGSVCPEMVPVLQQLGFRWMATDEGIFFRSLARAGAPETPRRELYEPCEAEWEEGRINVVFRDRMLSDFVGFSASKNPAREAASFILQRIEDISAATAGKEDPLTAIILDGENAWEHFPDGGEAFLDAWYAGLAGSKDWRTTTLAEHAALPVIRRRLGQLHTGSWIQANFDIWIGDPEENRAWELLGRTRRWWEERRAGIAPELAERVWMEIYAAEGSDWFWWYGPDFITDNDLLFDLLFRTHLQNVYRLCGAEAPADLFSPICRPAEAAIANTAPLGSIHPCIDGRVTTFFEWRDAGVFQPGQARGSMFQGERVVTALCYGTDTHRLFLRFDCTPALVKHNLLEVIIEGEGVQETRLAWHPATAEVSLVHAPKGTEARFARVLEVSLPLRPGSASIRFSATLIEGREEGAVQLERLPPSGWIECALPDHAAEAANWSA
jgi:alpha-amylase/alpha-mannosidase (GH57 family)